MPVPLPVPSGTAVTDETISDAAAVGTRGRSADITRGQIAAEAEPSADFGKASAVGENKPRAMRAIEPAVDQRADAVVTGVSLLWLAGVLVGLARLALGWRQLAALSRATRPLDVARHSETLDRVRTVLGMPALPAIMTSATARGPVAVGLLRPRVVLPEGLADSISGRSLCEVLVHECAHVLRRDAWVGLLQRLAGALFWPHPLVHHAKRQLTRAREEVCDNFVLRCGDPCGYARTLLALTDVCRPLGVVRPGLGLIASRWTLADRVAGIIDPRRRSMTSTSFRLKVALAIALVVTGLSVASIRFGSSAQAGQPAAAQAEPKSNLAAASDCRRLERRGRRRRRTGPAGGRSNCPHDARV